MLLQVWRYTTLMLAALLTGMTLCHVLEMPAKLQYPAAMYLTLHRTLYVAFGPPNVGVFIEAGAILSAIALVPMLRRRRGFVASLVGAACLAAGLAVYFALVEPANEALRAMPIDAPADDWTAWRNQWEFGHAGHFAFDFLGLSALICSVLRSPARPRPRPEEYRYEDEPARTSR
jgi:hypothetical protein